MMRTSNAGFLDLGRPFCCAFRLTSSFIEEKKDSMRTRAFVASVAS